MVIHISHSQIFGIPIYSICYSTASLFTFFLATYIVITKKPFQNLRFFTLIIFIWIGGVLGAKATYLLLTGISQGDIFKVFTSMESYTKGGFYLFGGIFAGLFTAFILLWAWNLQFWKSFIFILAVTFPCFVIGRLGCVFAGCCFGNIFSTENFPLLFQYDPHVYSTTLSQSTRLPVQLFNVLTMLVISSAVWRFARLKHWTFNTFSDTGGIISFVFIFGGASRFIEELFRDPLSRINFSFYGFYFSQWSGLFFVTLGILTGIIWIALRKRSGLLLAASYQKVNEDHFL